MSKNINVKLTFSADTRAAQQQMQQLQQTLSNIAATPITGSGLKATTGEIQAATSKAIELKIALQNATNVNTGKLNFNKFNQELKRNKMTLQEYAMQLQKLGPQGVQAFSQLATSIRQSETPLVAMQGRLAALGQTFMNTVKWSISSSMIQGVTRAFTSTIDYAKELNEGLNNIRIVTGKSIEDVSKFAVEANKAAKALSATTDEYVKASLIYFQQGLNDSAVAERTQTTLKLAKVVGESAETTSEWMTAIWNNFDNGSRSLENYADVLAKLGAATASSADEIAGGLEKFAAVAETVGLSYEYAASALATITAETRQSEDVVGTALKTIFARVENLKLGDTLEDGTTLGQYSQALEKVGVSIKDSNGNLKEMDDILKGIGTQWQILDRDQQVALAQSVAGIRQYSQFMALMDNWDTMEENVEMAKEANGALEDQHEIWETGIEGATSRVKEELNEIKNNLLGENDLLPLLNIAEGFLDFIGDLIDSLGGLPGLLSIIASVGLKLWGPQAAAGLQSMVNGVKSLYSVASGSAQADRSAMIKESAGLSAKMFTDSGMGNEEATTASKFSKDNAVRVIETEEAQGQLNETYKETLHLLEEIIRKRQEEAQLAAQNADKAADELEQAQNNIEGQGTQRVRKDPKTGKDVVYSEIATFDEQGKQGRPITATTLNADLEKAGAYESDIDKLGRSGQKTPSLIKEADSIMKTSTKSLSGSQNKEQLKLLEQQRKKYGELKQAIQNHEKVQKKSYATDKERNAAIKKSRAELKAATAEFKKSSKAVKAADNTVKKYSKSTKISEEDLKAVTDASGKKSKALKEEKESIEKVEKTQDNYNKKLEEGKKAGQGWTTSFISGMQGVASTAAGLQMLYGAFDSLTASIADGTAGFSDYLSAITSVGFALPMLVQGLGSVSKMLKLDVLWKKLSAAATKKLGNETKKEAIEEEKASGKKLAAKLKDIGSSIAQWVAKGPVGWIIAGISAAAVAALIGAAIAVNVSNKKAAAQEEETDNKAIETAEGALEVAEGWNEESQAMDELIDKHNKLKAANNQTIEGQKALKEAQQAVIDQVPQLIEKYKELDKEYENLDLSSDIAILEGAATNKDVEQVEQITNSIDQKIAQETSRIAKEGQSGAAGRTLAAIAKQTDDDVDNKTIDWHVGDVGSDIGEKKLSKILGQTFDGEGVNISLDAKDPKAFVEQYEKLQQFVKEMEEAGHTSDDTYREVKEGIDAAAESYEKLKTLVEDGTLYEIQDYINQKGIDPSKITSYQEYDNLVKQLIGDKELLKIADEEQIKTWLEGQKVLSEFASLEKKALAYRDKYGYELYDNMLKYAKSLKTEEDLEAFLKIDFDKYQVKETWDGLVKYIKKQEEAEKLQADLKAMTSAEKNLKSNGTVEDYQKLQESISWGEKGFIEYSEFLDKSYDQQKAYLEGMKISIAEQAQERAKAAEQELKATYKQTLADINLLSVKKELTKEEKEKLEALKVDLHYLEEEIEKNKINQKLAELQVKQAKEARAQRIRDFKNSKKAYEDEYDAYRHINEISEDLQKTLDKIASAKEAAYGSDYIALLNQEIRGLEVENDLLEKTIELANRRAAAHKNELAVQYGAQFDSFGNISNYNEIQAQQLQKLAQLEASQGKDSEVYKNAKQTYDDFVDLAEDYNEDLDKSEEATQEKADNMREILDKKLEGIEYEINIKIEVDDHYLNILERQLKRLDDDAYDGAERIINYGQQASKIYNKRQTNANGIQRVLRESGVSEADIEQYMQGNGDVVAKYNLSANAMESLEEYTNGFIESQEQFEELAETVKGEVMTTFTAWHDNISAVGDSIAAQGELIQNYRNIIDIVGKDKLGINDATLKALEQANNAAAQASLNNARVQKEATASALENAKANKAMYEEGTEEYELWQKTEEELSKQLEEDTANFMSSWESALTTAYETFTSETERAIEELSNFMAGINFDSMSDLAKSFEWQQEVSDRYLESYEKAYELSKLNRKIQKDIDSTDSVKAQKVMRDMQKEIAEKQAAGVEMSQHDLEILQKKYDLRLAEIAMEEARNAKSVVRLTRDSEGNFNYIYTVDQDSIDNTEQNYEDKLYAMQKSNDDYIENLSQQIVSNRQAMEEEIAAIDITAYASKKEYLAAVQKITERYTKKENYLLKEIQKTIQSNQDIYNEDVLAYGNFVGQRGTIDQAWVTKFEETPIAIATGFKTIQDAQTNLNTAIGDPNQGTGLLGTLSKTYDDLSSNVDNAMVIAGTSVTNFGTTVNTALYGEDEESGAIGDIKDLEQKTKDYEATAKDKFDKVATDVVNWYKKYGPKLQVGKKDTDNLEASIAKLESKDITIDTDVNGQDQVEALTTAIGKVKTAIENLQNADFKITANVNVNTGQYNPNDIDGDDDPKHNSNKSGAYQSGYKIQATGVDSQGYAITQVNGKWYNSRSVNNGQGKAGDEAIFINESTYKNNSLTITGPVKVNHKATAASGFFPKTQQYSRTGIYEKAYGGRKTKVIGGETYVKAKSSDYWYKLSEMEQQYNSTTRTYTDYYQIKKGQQAYKFDTGGYTGDWGPEGRMAMLHQKEIVLNAHDTENFLAAIGIVRDISDQIEKNAIVMQYQNQLANYRASVGNSGETLQQEVHITAEFPNATSHSEIEEAFRNLPNLAAQYANRK